MGAPAISTPARAPRPRSRPRPQPRRRASSAARSAPAKRAAPPSRSVALIPVTAVGRTAGAVSGLADCGAIVGMTRSRLWIGVLGVLLGGIVALNVWGLSLSSATSATQTKIDGLERENLVLRTRVAKRLSSDRVQEAAAALGLTTPEPRNVHFVDADPDDAAAAAKRLDAGEVSALSATPVEPELAVPTETTVAPVEPTVDPAAAVATETTTTETTTTVP